MRILDAYAVYLMVFSPLMAAIFITLIPTIDIGSKRAISRFFALIGFLAFFRVLALFLDHQLLTQYAISFKISEIYVNFSISINKYNIFLFGASSATILANMMLHELNDVKSNAHQVAPFILTFILFITFGQKDLRVALPIISISNFIIYFLIGYAEKIRRGSTIFHMGTFLFTCDTLALILLQYQEIVEGSTVFNLLQAAILIPGFARLTLPVFAPFMKKLFLNLDESEGPFIVTFLQLSGFFILILYRIEFSDISTFIFTTVEILTLASAIYTAFLALKEVKNGVIPYYFFVFYSSICACLLFVVNLDTFWHLSSALILSNIACFLHCTKTSLLVNQYRHLSAFQSRAKATWYLSLCLMAGMPGFGLGTSLWQIIYIIITEHRMGLSLGSLWLLAFLLMLYALILSVRNENFETGENRMTLVDFRTPVTKTFVIAPILVALLTLVIPLVTIYASSRVS